ncbi:uncharacterized protein LOC126377998 [Pectinophora gossypiella]|uniref:uncharacterized protein LOC126377998 n=1 Tax=Pectinophora gossypiella TaxID=13191 RepID=UPI00214F3644|nr:uncharacterized protein LOC126377998 [Pectinophora gossypiella]
MDEESLGRLCATGFSESDIKIAKDLLFDSISTTKRKKIRRRQGKTLRDIDDIICVLKELRPEEIPIFVARELHKLPPVTFDHVDVTRLLKDNLKMRYDLDYITEKYVTNKQLEELKLDIENLKRSSIVNNFPNKVNFKRGACLVDSFEYDSGPVGLPPAHVEQDVLEDRLHSPRNTCSNISLIDGSREIKSPAEIVRISTTDDVAETADRPLATAATGTTRMSHVCTPPAPAPHRHTAGPIVPEQNEIKTKTSDVSQCVETKSHDGRWKVVQNRKRNRFAANRGIAAVEENTNFKAADIKVPIYIYNVSKATTVCDVINYVQKKVNIAVTLVKMSMKVTKDYDAYKVFVPKQSLEMFLKNDFWPEGIAYRRFVDFGEKRSVKAGQTSKNLHK